MSEGYCNNVFSYINFNSHYLLVFFVSFNVDFALIVYDFKGSKYA